MKIESSRAMVWKSCWQKDNNISNTTTASIAKAMASETAFFCADTAVQMHGGLGYCEDTGVAKLLRDSKIFMIYEGTSEIQRTIIAKRFISDLQKRI